VWTLFGLAIALVVMMFNDHVGTPLALLIGGCWWLTSLVAAIQRQGQRLGPPVEAVAPFEVVRG